MDAGGSKVTRGTEVTAKLNFDIIGGVYVFGGVVNIDVGEEVR